MPLFPALEQLVSEGRRVSTNYNQTQPIRTDQRAHSQRQDVQPDAQSHRPLHPRRLRPHLQQMPIKCSRGHQESRKPALTPRVSGPRGAAPGPSQDPLCVSLERRPTALTSRANTCRGPASWEALGSPRCSHGHSFAPAPRGPLTPQRCARSETDAKSTLKVRRLARAESERARRAASLPGASHRPLPPARRLGKRQFPRAPCRLE